MDSDEVLLKIEDKDNTKQLLISWLPFKILIDPLAFEERADSKSGKISLKEMYDENKGISDLRIHQDLISLATYQFDDGEVSEIKTCPQYVAFRCKSAMHKLKSWLCCDYIKFKNLEPQMLRKPSRSNMVHTTNSVKDENDDLNNSIPVHFRNKTVQNIFEHHKEQARAQSLKVQDGEDKEFFD
ncbi:hypothetical protein RFI_18175 [Reticulomyxa filosa]|uniref:Uncharacterized protein n=1 Tax=Reticulomyxa filosa TaxID=46433 RepID=X6MZI0_RETFI|nr:hypothetical protein RFI_18175 [Reticulomyxa filosa]|eukprot:ETO19063.1 hypothetical protein RFI_18175 [Reticulomyxa filosa]